MPRDVRTVDSLLEELGSTVVEALHIANGGVTVLRDLLINDGAIEDTEVRGSVLLAIGSKSSADIAGLLDQLGPEGLAAIVLSEDVELSASCRTLATTHAVTILRSTGALNWSRLAEAIWRFLSQSEREVLSDGSAAATADLFRFADAVSNLFDAPVTIEDLSSKVVAFSQGQQDVDPARTASILDLRVPEQWQAEYRATGVYERIYRDRRPAFICSSGDILPRLAVAIVAGSEVLGSMWAAVVEEPSDNQLVAFQNAANAAAPLLLRRRHEVDPERRRQEDLLLGLLEGRPNALDAARRLGLEGRTVCVLAAKALDPIDGSDEARSRADRLATMHRLGQSLSLHLATTNPRGAVAMVEGVIYAAFALPSSAIDTDRAVGAANSYVARLASTARVVIGVGRTARTIEEVALSKTDADGVLEVLCEEAETNRVASVSDFQGRMLLRRVRELAAAERLPPARQIEALQAHDAEHHTGLFEALGAYLDSFGNALRAAERLGVHPNTLRYRMRNVTRIGDIDLEDPGTRFELMLQLRLRDFEASST